MSSSGEYSESPTAHVASRTRTRACALHACTSTLASFRPAHPPRPALPAKKRRSFFGQSPAACQLKHCSVTPRWRYRCCCSGSLSSALAKRCECVQTHLHWRGAAARPRSNGSAVGSPSSSKRAPRLAPAHQHRAVAPSILPFKHRGSKWLPNTPVMRGPDCCMQGRRHAPCVRAHQGRLGPRAPVSAQ